MKALINTGNSLQLSKYKYGTVQRSKKMKFTDNDDRKENLKANDGDMRQLKLRGLGNLNIVCCIPL